MKAIHMHRFIPHRAIAAAVVTLVVALPLAFAFASTGAPQAHADLTAGDVQLGQVVELDTQSDGATSEAQGELGDCTWILDGEGTLTFSPKEGTSGYIGKLTNTIANLDKSAVVKVVFETGVKAKDKNLEYAFFGKNVWTSLKTVDASGLDVSEATSFRYMFAGPPSLESVDASTWSTSNVEDMGCMFVWCSNLKTVDVSNWDTSKVQGMGSMFYGCESLASLNVSNWDTSAVVTEAGDVSPHPEGFIEMFKGCSSLEELDVSDWDLSGCEYMNRMFDGCSSLEQLDVSNWDTSNVRNLLCAFRGCSNLKTLDVSQWSTSSVTGFYGVFNGCESLQNIDVSKWETAKGESFAYMFEGCSSLKNLDVSSFNTKKALSMQDMFAGCSSLEAIVLGKDFSFQCDEGGSAETSLVGSTDPKYSEAWSGPGGTFTSADFTSRYSGDTMAGTYVKMPTIAGASVSGITNRTYTGKAQTQSAKLALGGAALAEGADYAVSYKNNVNAGTATVTFTGKGDYAGSLSKTFKISPAPISKAKLALAYTAKAYTGKALKPTLKTASFNGAALKKGAHYALAYKSNKAVGTATVTVAGRGNFAGTKKLTFTVRMPKPTVSLKAHAGKLTSGQKGIDVSWKMKPMPPAAQVTGYVVQFSTSKSFPKGKTRTSAVTITAANKYKALYAKRAAVATGGTHFKMRANTVYYVRVKAYRKVGGKTYATWSDAAKCRTSK